MTSRRAPLGDLQLRLMAGLARALARRAPALAVPAAERLFFTPPRRPAFPRETAALEGARTGWVEVGGARVRTYAWGQGPVAVLVHGWGGSAGQMASALAPVLLARGYSVVTFDAPGHGASGGSWSSIPEFGRALLAVAHEHGPVHAAVGHSMGASAIAFTLTEGLSVGRIALIGPSADPARWTAQFAARLSLTPEVMRRLRVRAERRLAFRWADLPMERLLAGHSLPVLVVHDRDDREIPWQEGASVAEAVRSGTLVTTRGLGHRRIVSDAEVAAIVADFADGRPVGERAGPPCGRPSCAGTASGYGLCDACALEADLFEPARRRITASS